MEGWATRAKRGAATGKFIVAVQDAMPGRADLLRFTTTGNGRNAMDAVIAATTRECPEQVAELRALAEGAGMDYDVILLANLRGDVGVDDGTGCSDLAWQRESSFVAHNEDGTPTLLGHFMLLTLELDGELPVTTQWYPGFSPSNALAANSAGLIWGIDHIRDAAPIVAPGRHFVARGLQRCTSLEAVIDYLRTHPSAGGFTYTVGAAGTGGSAIVEAVAARVAVRSATKHEPFQWHTNHVRFLPDVPTASADGAVSGNRERYPESVARGEVLAGLTVPEDEPDAAWFEQILSDQPMAYGVHRSASDEDPLMTLCTTVADLGNDRLYIRSTVGSDDLSLSSFARGELA